MSIAEEDGKIGTFPMAASLPISSLQHVRSALPMSVCCAVLPSIAHCHSWDSTGRRREGCTHVLQHVCKTCADGIGSNHAC
jgi:hypothetical protein